MLNMFQCKKLDTLNYVYELLYIKTWLLIYIYADYYYLYAYFSVPESYF